MKKFCGLLILSLFSYVCSATGSAKLQPLLDEIWQYNLSISPILATSQGVHDFDNKLADVSPDALEKQDSQFRAFLKKLSLIDKTELNRTEQISLLIQQRNLQNHIDQYRFNAHYMPLTSESSFHSSLAFLPRSSRFETLGDYQNYLARLEQFPSYFEQQINWMRKGIQSGFIQPKVVLQGFEDSVKAFIHDSPEDSIFYTPFQNLQGANVDSIQQQKLGEQASLIIANQIFSAYQKFYDFLITEYIPKSKTNIAAKSLPNGSDYYQNRSDFYTTTQMSVDDIHSLGLDEVKRIRSEMQTVVDQLEYKGNINQFIQYLRTDKKFYAQTADELIKQASYIAKKMDAKLPQLFNYLPRTPYGVEPVPENIAPKYTTGRYISPTNDSQPGYYWVNTYALDKRPLYALTALTLHEAVPGHHLQISLSREMTELPEVRRYTYISAFGEGWGLYSEFLGKEVGMYNDPYDEFGRLSYEMWRACRLVVDTGMHIKGWSRQKAIDFMLENTALSEHNVKTEIDRYISWPAQALSYKIGELTIKKLRKQTEVALGEQFDLRAFHHAVLKHGSVPLSVLEANIQQFIQQQ
ncbi:DUF885 family protein [Paraglaciecola sp. MB-3u-78]|uniref:DUF885 domain-containing protein n=1 Tax=Paraglaciecola sp. MB-3u-78 TaxID=2058332 RepID=UPI000C32D397|nr:DUF885 domain-containing protein [Paraglaciecola sp. MB-3u-78]PKG97933.1 DUF885 domain-containing protein [Paraglaciecola sp. MB-3u-78]